MVSIRLEDARRLRDHKPDVVVTLAGGGRNYVAYAGALFEAQRHVNIRALIGVSAGAIAACMFAARRTGRGSMWDAIERTLPGGSIKLDRRWLGRLRWPCGEYSGENIRAAFQRELVAQLGEARVPLMILTYNLDRQRRRVWSSWSDPDKPLDQILAASMAVPFLFNARTIGGEVHVDAGIASNMPLDLARRLPGDLSRLPQWGIRARGVGKARRRGRRAPIEFGADVAEGSILSNMREDVEDAPGARILSIDVPEGSLDVELTQREARGLWDAGTLQMRDWITNRRAATGQPT